MEALKTTHKIVHNNKVEQNRISKVEEFLQDRFEFRCNIISNELESKRGEEKIYSVCNENSIYRELQHNNLKYSMSDLLSLLKSDFVIEFNPFENYFKSIKAWDATKDPDHISRLASYIKTTSPDRFEYHLKKHLVRTVACALEDGVYNKHALILLQRKQNTGKSYFCRWLCPKELKRYLGENITLDKDGLISLAENFLINLDELASLSRADINQLKTILSKDRVKVRRPYERKSVTIPRRASFIGSSNSIEFLNDETGSVRWICFELLEIDFSYSNEIEINDIWSQAYSLYITGYNYELSTEDILDNERENIRYHKPTTEQELIMQHYKPGTKNDHDKFMNASQILDGLFEQGHRSKLSQVMIGKALTQLCFEKGQESNGAYTTKGYYVNFINKPIQ